MNRRSLALVCLAAIVAVLAFSAAALVTRAQRSRNHGVVHNMSAWVDTNSGAHPDKFTITGPALITCVRATSEVPHSNPAPACRISANGFNGTMAPPNSNATLKAGDITLSCVGQGTMLHCDARVDIPPPGQQPAAPATPPSQ
ncbi:MAG: hypothetical protein ABSC71_08080 [Candidatus Acidiferrales bacterium]|jgi:hypothetical protein